MKPAFSILVATFLLSPQNLPAVEFPLSDIAVRDAYFLGERNDQKTLEFLKLYTRSFPLPDKGPYISEIHLLTPYAQVVSDSSRHSVGYSAQQADADYHRRGDTLLLQIRIELTPTYTYDDAVHTADDTASELDRQLYPEDFWQAFQFKFSQDEKPFKPRAISADPIAGAASPSDRGPTLRGIIVSLEFAAEQVESGIVQRSDRPHRPARHQQIRPVQTPLNHTRLLRVALCGHAMYTYQMLWSHSYQRIARTCCPCCALVSSGNGRLVN